ncbi:MAG TPA: hypothetical protein DCY20_05100 [Firmicutes bacterium]|nr:hypothetical protein [Bacillota bacterium]
MNLIYIFYQVLNIYSFLILIYVLMSWVPESRSTQLGRILSNFVEPYLSIFRKVLPPIGMIDFSSIFAYMVLQFAMVGLARLVG